jgi:hypothetical protein
VTRGKHCVKWPRLDWTAARIAAALGLMGGCGVDNVPFVNGELGRKATGGSATVGATGGSEPDAVGGVFSGGSESFVTAGGMAGAGARTSSGGGPVVPEVEFFACQSGADRIDVRGVRGARCWLVVLARNSESSEQCHPDAEVSRGWCVVNVEFRETEAECSRPASRDTRDYLSSGKVVVSAQETLELDLDFRTPDQSWRSDVPFAVAGCSPNCSEFDCRH